jgi:hypothetical protein
MTSRITGDLPDDGEAVTAVDNQALESYTCSTQPDRIPARASRSRAAKQIGSEAPAAVALMNPQALDPRRTTPCPAMDARSQLAVLVTNGGEDFKPRHEYRWRRS